MTSAGLRQRDAKCLTLSALRCFAGPRRVFCVLTAYIDESYNERTLCVGGWLCSDERWNIIEEQWLARVEYERRVSRKQGQRKIARYHASDCQNLKGSFASWSVRRQILFVKRLIEIIAKNRPVGLAVGLSFRELAHAFPEQPRPEWHAYRLCMLMYLLQLANLMAEHFPHHKVTIIHDRGQFNSAALSAFDSLKSDSGFPGRERFITIAPMGWQDCIALQSADLLAFEGYKLVDARKRRRFDLRKSLQKIIGDNVPLTAMYFTGDGLLELARAVQEAPHNPSRLSEKELC